MCAALRGHLLSRPPEPRRAVQERELARGREDGLSWWLVDWESQYSESLGRGIAGAVLEVLARPRAHVKEQALSLGMVAWANRMPACSWTWQVAVLSREAPWQPQSAVVALQAGRRRRAKGQA